MKEPSWSVVTSSTPFSAFAAVMAALMFAAMVLLLTREVHLGPEGRVVGISTERSIENPLTFMFGSFFSLVVAAFLFAATAGDQDPITHIKQFVEGSMPALVLSFGVVQMAVALSWLLAQRQQLGLALELSRYVVHATVIIAAFFLAGIVVSPLTLVNSNLLGGPFDTWVVLGLVIASAVAVGTAGRGFVLKSKGAAGMIRYVNLAAVVIAIVSSVIWNTLSGVQDADLGWLYKSPGGFVMLGFALVAFTWFSALEIALPDPADTGPLPSPHDTAQVAPRNSGEVLSDADIAVFRVVSEHFRNDLMIFWQQTGLFLVAVGALLTLYMQASPASSLSWFLGVLGILLTFFWFWVGWHRERLIDTWRGHLIKIDGLVDRYKFYVEVEQGVRNSPWTSPTKVTRFLPLLLVVAWLVLLVIRSALGHS